MGQEIETSRFEERDFVDFRERLRVETAILAQWFRAGRFVADTGVGGYELEAWLVDPQLRPAPG